MAACFGEWGGADCDYGARVGLSVIRLRGFCNSRGFFNKARASLGWNIGAEPAVMEQMGLLEQSRGGSCLYVNSPFSC